MLLKEYEAQAELQAATAASHTAWKEAARLVHRMAVQVKVDEQTRER